MDTDKRSEILEMLAEYAEAAELNRTLAEEHMEAFSETLQEDIIEQCLERS